MAGLLDRLTVTPRPPGHEPGGFDCGEPDLNEYLSDGTAENDEAASVARTYLIHDGDTLVGYFSVLSDAIRLSGKERPGGTNYSSAPALKLGRMGVHKDYRGQHVGRWILDYVVGLARSLSKQLGIRYITLDALPRERLVQWYEGYGFVRNPGEEKGRKIIREFFRRIPIETDLPNVSMRFDILLEEEMPTK